MEPLSDIFEYTRLRDGWAGAIPTVRNVVLSGQPPHVTYRTAFATVFGQYCSRRMGRTDWDTWDVFTTEGPGVGNNPGARMVC